MSDTLRLLLFLAGYVVLMRWVLPWLGVPTCMSGTCGTPVHRARASGPKKDVSAEAAEHPVER